MSAKNTLETATLDRKARLAHLKSLKRKAPHPSDPSPLASPGDGDSTPLEEEPPTDETPAYLSGRNYDAATRGPKLGFETAPTAGLDTVELQAARLAQAEKAQRQKEAAEDAPLDLFKLQPRRPNWDLKRELERRLEPVNVRTQNAIARLVRERVQKQDGERSGGELVEGMRELEREAAAEREVEGQE